VGIFSEQVWGLSGERHQLIIGMCLAALATIGWTYKYLRGEHSI
jgi:hypothetical protein